MSGGVSKIRKYAYIDILRACAILGVLAVHASQDVGRLSPIVSATANYGQLGVQLFFIASAITLCLSASERKEHSPYNFFVRRFFRIAPLYYFGIVLYLVWRSVSNAITTGRFCMPDGYTLSAILQNILFIHGFSPSNYNLIVPGGWSISTEVMFYLMFPALFFLLSKLTLRAFTILCAGVLVLSFLAEYVIINFIQPFLVEQGLLASVETNDGFGFLYAFIINQINVFMIGLIAFKLLNKKIPSSLLAVAVALILCSWFIQNNRTHDTGYDGLIYTVLSAVAFAIIAVRLSQSAIPHNALSMVATSIGRNSFSMYITHFAVLDVLRIVLNATVFRAVHSADLRVAITFPALVGLTYIVARATAKLVEEPGIRLGRRFTQGPGMSASGALSRR